MKAVVTFCILAVLVTACRHVEPERRSTEAEIREHIVGAWTAYDDSNCWYPSMIIADDGSLLVGVKKADGTKALIGKWEMSRHLLRVTPTPERLEAARAAGFIMNEWDYYPVIYADAHELVTTPGISMAGRWRYKK